MRKSLLMALSAATITLASCGNSATDANNPFFSEWNTPFEVPPFNEIKNSHFMPAFLEGMKQEKEEINTIIRNSETPNFENTILAYTETGELLSKIGGVFYSLTGTEMSPELEKIQAELSPIYTAHGSDISLNDSLFQRIKSVYNNREALNLDALQMRLTERVYKGFERSGANLNESDKEALREIDIKLGGLTLDFSKNLRKDNTAFTLEIDNKEDLAGLSEALIANAAAEATNRGKEGKWIFTLDSPSIFPFLQYSEKRELREKIFTGYLERCNNNNENDNKLVIDSIANLRLERAKLLGYTSHADFVLTNNMSKNAEAVYSLLEDLWKPAISRAKDELAQMKKIKGDNDFQPWDWWYYAEKLRAEKYNLNEDELRPYFALPNVLDGLFDVTNKLYGLTYKDITATMPLYNKENKVFEVTDKDGSHLGVVYFDFHPRASKRVGAWCGGFRSQKYKDGKKITPIVSIVCNFTKPVGDAPALLSLDEVETLFHEYGHGLHSLFRDVKYSALSSVERDFVELPSQVMENWAFEPQVLAMYAKHYQTGELIPNDLVEKVQNSALFNQGFATVEYLGASLLDMDYHTITESKKIDVPTFEKASIEKYGSMKEIAPRYRSTYFQHIFSSGYSAGYYSYIWAEVLDKDAYAAFVESGDIFNTEIAEKFRKELLSQGTQLDGGDLYRNFRGKDASREPLMKGRGLVK